MGGPKFEGWVHYTRIHLNARGLAIVPGLKDMLLVHQLSPTKKKGPKTKPRENLVQQQAALCYFVGFQPSEDLNK
jgi:hypothetical protein